MARAFFEENITTTDPTTHETDDTTPLTPVLMTGDSSDRAPDSQPDISLDSFTDMVQEIYEPQGADDDRPRASPIPYHQGSPTDRVGRRDPLGDDIRRVSVCLGGCRLCPHEPAGCDRCWSRVQPGLGERRLNPARVTL